MEPLSAISLASNIISFLDFGLNIFSTSKALYSSHHGATDEQVDLQATVEDLKEMAESLATSSPALQGSRRPSPEQVKLEALAQKCRAVAQELLDALQSLLVRPGNRVWVSSLHGMLSKAWAAVCMLWQCVWF